MTLPSPDAPLARKTLVQRAVHELFTPGPRRVPFLDALRTLAVLLVVNQHASIAIARNFGDDRYTRFLLTRDGWMGVDLFFVLSGFFIGGQLWKELRRTATISYSRFMLRRGLRIWPLYFFIFLVVLLAHHGAPERQHGWSDLVFLTNYTNHGIVMGSWSLCSEEQFYLLAPLTLLLLGNLPLRRFRWGLAALMLLVLAVRIATYVHLTGRFFTHSPEAFARLYYPFHTHCDGLLAGLFVAALAIEAEHGPRLAQKRGLLVLAAAVLLLILNRVQSETTDFFALAVFFAALVWWGLTFHARFWENRFFYVLSRLSFGMYLNHEYFGTWMARHIVPRSASLPFAALTGGLLNFAALSLLSAALAAVTFCLVEHPFLELRDRLLARKAAVALVAH